MSVRGMGQWLKRIYDRIIASVVLTVLFVSLIMLAVHAQLLKGRQQAFDNELNRLKPKHAEAQPVDRSGFTADLKLLANPMQVAEWTNHMLLPELRVNCVNCDRPIPYAATNCPFCKAPQPAEVAAANVDRDNDGMPDEWETAHGFDPLDPADARSDADNDGFTNLEEFRFGTDPRNPASHPPPLAKVTVGAMTPIPFTLVFKSVNRIVGKTLYQINLRQGGRTYWAALGDEVEGFKVIAYDEKAPEGPTLTVERSGKQIALVKGKVVPRSEYEITLISGFDGARIPVRVDAEFEVKGSKYQVKKVDTAANRVLIHDPSRDTDVWIAGGETPNAPSVRDTKE